MEIDTPPFTYTAYLLDENEDVIEAVPSSIMLYSQDIDGNAWLTYNGGLSYLQNLDCGVYSLKITTDRGRVVCWTEDFRVMNMNGLKNAYKIYFRNTTDVDGIVYQGSYYQNIWLLNAIFDTPDIVQPTENVTDGNVVEVLTFQSVQTRDVLKFPYMPDFWQGTLHRIRMMDTVTIKKMETGEVFDIAGRGIDLTSEEQDIVFKKGILSWISATQVTGGCEENKEMVYLNSSPV